jgi:hypothetical protein
MFAHFKQQWQELSNGKPGRRFQEYYLRRHFAARGRMRKLLVMTTGLAIFAAGLFFLVVPGPGLLFMLVGASMIAEESYLAARTLDRLELLLLRIRRLAERAIRAWHRWPAFGKLIILLAAVITGAVGWAAYSL